MDGWIEACIQRTAECHNIQPPQSSLFNMVYHLRVTFALTLLSYRFLIEKQLYGSNGALIELGAHKRTFLAFLWRL